MHNLSIRLTDTELAELDQLVAATRRYYQDKAITNPGCARIADACTRSSAIRDLLNAWRRGQANELFIAND
jgi:hypothetical protein